MWVYGKLLLLLMMMEMTMMMMMTAVFEVDEDINRKGFDRLVYGS